MAVAVQAHAAMRRQRGTLGVPQALVGRQTRRLALLRERDGFLWFDGPGVVKVQLHDGACHVGRIRQARAWVFGRVAGNGAGLAHGLVHRGVAQVAGTGGAFALPHIDGHTEAAITVVFDGVDLAHAYRDRQALLQADIGFGLAGAQFARPLQQARHHCGEFRNAACVDFLCHRRIVQNE